MRGSEFPIPSFRSLAVKPFECGLAVAGVLFAGGRLAMVHG
jgi:hypothetical protein